MNFEGENKIKENMDLLENVSEVLSFLINLGNSKLINGVKFIIWDLFLESLLKARYNIWKIDWRDV